MRQQQLYIYGRLPGMNELLGADRRHWAAGYKLKREAMDKVMQSALICRIKPVKGKAHIVIKCYEPNARRDEDNVKFGAFKIILDALQKNGVLINDSRKYITQEAPPVEIDRADPRIIVTIYDDFGEGENVHGIAAGGTEANKK